LLSANNFRDFRAVALACTLLASLGGVESVHAQGGSAVITLVMPVGARQLGMGEAATAISDDVYGTYWNPGGLAFGPVANEWELMLPRVSGKDSVTKHRHFTTLVTRPRSGFLVKSIVWAGAQDGLYYYDGKRWREAHEYVMEEGDKIESIVRRYVGGGDHLDSLVARVKRYNHVYTKEDEEELITLKMPYNLLFPGQTVRALTLDNSDRLWVGTASGLFRFDGQGWKSFDREEGFTYVPDTSSAQVESAGKSDSIKASAAPAKSPFRQLSVTALAVKGVSIWIGTEDGLYEYKKNSIIRRGENILPSQYITSIGTHPEIDEIYVGLKGRGLARYKGPKASGAAAKWKIFTTADGLLDSNITQIALDKYGHVYTSHDGGVSHFSLRAWEKLHFRNQHVRGMSVDDDGRVWIATSEGAWKFTPAHTTPKGRRDAAERAGSSGGSESSENLGGDWAHFHTGNGLTSKDVLALKTQGGDVWFLTDAGVERYHNAKAQVGFFYENLLPVLNLTDLYHAFLGATFPIEEWGTLGGFVNFVSFGQNLQTGTDASDQAKFDAYELVAALTYATRLNKNAGVGVNAKFIYSALTQGVTSSGEKTDGVAASYAVDLGFIQKNLFTLKGLSFGLMMQNMGPAVFYVDQAQSDPIPFTWKVGLAYELIHTPNHRLTIAGDANREAFYRYGNKAAPVWVGAWKEILQPSGTDGFSLNENLRRTVYNTGAEYVYANVVAVRGGYLHDISGQRYEMDIGLGFMLSDILQIDGTFIKSFDNGIRNGQKRFSMILRF
jgi:ligand-binding sensor domain-containing protein